MRTILFLFIMTLSFKISKAQWVELDPGVDDVLYDIYAITPDIAVAVGANGTIIKSIDGGETWQQKESGTTKNLLKVQFPTSEIGYITAMGNTFWKTIDGGETWFSIDGSSNCFFHNFSWVSEELIYNTCSGVLVKSIDGGYSWTDIGSVSLESLQFKSNNIGYGRKSNGNLLKTENGGETWMELNYIANPFQFLDENTGFFYGYGLYKTIDGGYNFEHFGGGEGWELTNIYVIDENNIWGILIGALDGDPTTRGIVKVHILEDGTYTEDIWYDGDSGIDMARIHFADEHTGYIVGYKYGNPTIWKNGTGTNTMSTNEPIAMHEIKIYPIPTTDEINISFEKPFSGVVSLYDFTGKQICSSNLIKKNNAHINVGKLAKGTYILTVKGKENTYSKKIIIN